MGDRKNIRKLGLPATVLRPVAFMEGLLERAAGTCHPPGQTGAPVRAGKPYQTIATDDIGGFLAATFERPTDFMGLEPEIAGSELTNPQAAEVFSQVLGKPVEFIEMPIPEVKEYSQMFHWFNDAEFQADIGALRKRYPELPLSDA